VDAIVDQLESSSPSPSSSITPALALRLVAGRAWAYHGDMAHPLDEQIPQKLAQREANARAAAAGEPLPYPNVWDALDPTKVDRDATPEQITQRVREFNRRCRKPVKRYTI